MRASGPSGAGFRPRRRRIHESGPRESRRPQRAQLALERARLRASQEHYFRGRRLQAAERYEEALVEFQVASELNPTAADVEAALRDTRQKLRTRLAVIARGKTELQSLIERSRDLAPAGLELPEGVKLPDSLVFSNAEQPHGVHGARPLRQT